MVFIPPEEQPIPKLYTAAADLSHGACIVVAYGEAIILYSIPLDVIQLSQTEQKADSWDVYTAPLISAEGGSEDHWLNWWDEPTVVDARNGSGTNSTHPIWPLAIRGTEIGRCEDICALAAQTQPDIIVWAFTHSSQCKTWRLHNYIDPVVPLQQYVCRDGFVHDAYSVDGTGDVIMSDAPAPARHNTIDLHVHGDQYELPAAERAITLGFDRNASGVLKRMPKALAVENDDWVDLVDVRGCDDAWYDADGDVVMFYQT
jgi:hypothetical protein